jgi:hypothetical protein
MDGWMISFLDLHGKKTGSPHDDKYENVSTFSFFEKEYPCSWKL